MLFLCRWPNGDFSVVKASSKDEAIELLDEIGNAEGSPVTPINDTFMVHFVLTDDGDFELQGWGEETGELIMKRAYPVLDEARMSSLDKSDTEQWRGHRDLADRAGRLAARGLANQNLTRVISSA